MAVIAGDLVTRLGIDGRKFQSGLQKARGDARSFVADVGKIVSGLALYDIGKSITSSLIGVGKSTVNLAADAEVTRAEFGVLLGDVNKGVSMFEQIEKFASRTSFNIESASDAMRSLMAAGVKEGDLFDTMQLLGDLSLGDANKLGFLSKAYTDVFNKGRLQGQEIKQFAENGVGLVQALSATLNKPAEEILKMSENGQISFQMMQDALKSLTAEGGRFYGAMEARNKTFRGQWDSIIENIQSAGRDLGEMVLPKLTQILTEANKIVQAFNDLGDARWRFLGDVIVASFDVAIEAIKEKWDDAILTMAKSAADVLVKAIEDPFLIKQQFELFKQIGQRQNAPSGLEDAKNKLETLLGKLNINQPTPQVEWQGPREQGFAASVLRNMQKSGDGIAAAQNASTEANMGKASKERSKPQSLTDTAKGLLKALTEDPIVVAAKNGVGGIMDRAELHGGALVGMLENWFGATPQEQAKKEEPRLAGAMQQGSQEAFSTIFAAMLQRGKDPVVKATEKGAAMVVKAIKDNKPQMMLAMGAVNP